jgi:type II secretory pathway component PulF
MLSEGYSAGGSLKIEAPRRAYQSQYAIVSFWSSELFARHQGFPFFGGSYHLRKAVLMSNRDALLTPDPKAAEQAWLSREELGIFSWAWGELISSGVPILETLAICAEVFPHPRLRWMCAQAWQQIRDGEGLEQGWSSPPGKGGMDPNFLSMVLMGEESGELDLLLRKYAAQALKNEPLTLAGALNRSHELTIFTTGLSTRQDAGLPIVRSLKELAQLPSLTGVTEQIDGLLKRVEGGDALSEALTAFDGSTLKVDPVYRAIINAGEVGGVLDIVLQRLVQQNERLSNAS